MSDQVASLLTSVLAINSLDFLNVLLIGAISELETTITALDFSLGWLQLFKTREGKYLLDLQQVSGPNFLFLELCASILAEVGAVWHDICSPHMSLFSVLPTNFLFNQLVSSALSQSLNRYGYGCVHCFRTFISILNKLWFTAVRHSWCRILEDKRIGLPQTSFLHTL